MPTELEVLETVNQLARSFSENPYLFLTEGDIQAYLVNLLMGKNTFNQLQETSDGKYTYTVHTETSFFGENGKLNNRVDLAIIDVKTLDVHSKRPQRRLAKDYAFGDADFGIEIKFNRQGSKRSVLNGLRKDCSKITRLKATNSSTTFIAVYFDKKSRLNEEELGNLEQEFNLIKLIYVTPSEATNND